MPNDTKKIQVLAGKAALAILTLFISTAAFAGMGGSQPPISVPEPGTLALIAAGVAGMYVAKKKKK